MNGNEKQSSEEDEAIHGDDGIGEVVFRRYPHERSSSSRICIERLTRADTIMHNCIDIMGTPHRLRLRASTSGRIRVLYAASEGPERRFLLHVLGFKVPTSIHVQSKSTGLSPTELSR